MGDEGYEQEQNNYLGRVVQHEHTTRDTNYYVFSFSRLTQLQYEWQWWCACGTSVSFKSMRIDVKRQIGIYELKILESMTLLYHDDDGP